MSAAFLPWVRNERNEESLNVVVVCDQLFATLDSTELKVSVGLVLGDGCFPHPFTSICLWGMVSVIYAR